MSSTSLLFDADWTTRGTQHHACLVARMAPEPSAVPVSPSYDLPGQYALIEQVTARCNTRVPRLRWNAPDGGTLGTAFFIMDQVDGQVPLDNSHITSAAGCSTQPSEIAAGCSRAESRSA